MKKHHLLLIVVLTMSPVVAQNFYVETGILSSNFTYENSVGAEIGNYQPATSSYLAVGYKDRFFIKRVQWGLGFARTGYGAVGNGDVMDYLAWDLKYLEVEFHLNVELFYIRDFTVYGKGGFSSGFMLSGTQTINTAVYDLKEIDQFSNGIANFKFGLGLSYPIIKEMSLYLEYVYGSSLNVEKNTDETLNIRSNRIGLGLSVNLFSK